MVRSRYSDDAGPSAGGANTGLVPRVFPLVLVASIVAAGATAAVAQPQPAPPVTLATTAPSSAPVASEAPSDGASPAASATPLPSPTAAPTPIPAPLALAKLRLQLNPGGTTTVAIAGGVAPYSVAFGPPSPALASGSPAASAAAALAPPTPAPPPVASATSSLATATIDETAGTLVVRAAAPAGGGAPPPAGTASVVVTDASGASVTASLLVGPNAGFVPETLPLALVGNPSQDFTNAQIDAAIRRRANVLPDARVVIAPRPVPSVLPAGQTLAIPVRVHLDGVGKYVDVDTLASVLVTTSAAPPLTPTTLFYSDDPESVGSDGVLFRGTVSSARAVRLYYYHQALTPGHQIAIVFDAPTGAAQVTVVGQGAGPNPAVFYVGQSATYRYLDDRARGSGVALDVPVGAAVIVGAGDAALARADLVAGVLDIGVTSGDPVRLTVLSYPAGTDPRGLLDAPELPDDGFQRRGEYDLAQSLPIALTERLPAGTPSPAPAADAPSPSPEPPAAGAPLAEPTVLIGAASTALANLRPGGRSLLGDYGVLHPVTLTLGNDGDAPGTLYFYEQPVTGYPVTTSIAFDGDPAPLRLMCVKVRTHRYLVRAFTVAPHATTVVAGAYMTDGGSTYPIAFGLTATPPSPLPPSMVDPDGCFPKPAASGS